MVRRKGSARQWIGKRMSPLLYIVPALTSPGRIWAQPPMSTFSQNVCLVIHFPFLSLQYVSGHSNPILLPKSCPDHCPVGIMFNAILTHFHTGIYVTTVSLCVLFSS